MGKKLEHNGLWESSRMMLPQHKEQSLLQAKVGERQKKPTLDMQEQDRILQEITTALREKTEITLTVFDQYKNREITGVPCSYSQQQRALKIDIDNDIEWISFSDILGATVANKAPWD
ncbi:YolD-like family protein [Paenibacillus sp. HJGM_3]|uniref:YolD-like family protein n=1 Tax=Paenibacillus sp. HJGM_3 TaxID=3379816 RepID=UPI00385B2DF8